MRPEKHTSDRPQGEPLPLGMLWPDGRTLTMDEVILVLIYADRHDGASAEITVAPSVFAGHAQYRPVSNTSQYPILGGTDTPSPRK